LPEQEANLNETIGNLLGVLSRGRWWILLTGALVTVATVVVVYKLPNKYSSEATLEIVQPQVSPSYVQPTSLASAEDSVKAMSRVVLSRSRLVPIVNEFGLYSKERAGMSDENLADLMRKGVAVEPVDQLPGRSEFTAFKISFSAENPQLAQAVTSRLTSVFIEEHLKARESISSMTTKFLEEQLDAARKRAADLEGRQRAFQMQYLGELPDQQQANFGLLTSLETQLQKDLSDDTRLEQDTATIQGSLKENLARLQAERSTLLSRFTPRHPEVLKKDQDIAKVQSILNHVNGGGDLNRNDPTFATDANVTALLNRVDTNQRDKERLAQEEKRLRAEISQYQSKLNLAPVRQDQLSGILRDRDLYLQEIRDLQSKLIQAQQASKVETEQEGQQFRLVDPPTLPGAPASPKRLKISLGGAAAGIGLGLALAFLIDMRNTSFRDEKAMIRQLGLPWVMGVPVLETEKEERRHRWITVLEWIGGTVAASAIVAVELFVFRHP